MKDAKHEPMLYTTNAAVNALNRTPGFDPLKFLRRTTAQNGEEVMKLDLRYKKLWFRLACPQGRLRLNRLRITEQLAIFEAQVYLNRGDTEPISSFTSCQTREDAPQGQYVQAAQEEAMDAALTCAGFGVQFGDVSAKAEPYGTEVTPGNAAKLATPGAARTEATVQRVTVEDDILPSIATPKAQISAVENTAENSHLTETNAPLASNTVTFTAPAVQPTMPPAAISQTEETPAAEANMEQAAVETAPVIQAVERVEAPAPILAAAPLAQAPVQTAAPVEEAALVAEPAAPAIAFVQPEPEPAPTEADLHYTPDMPVADIVRLMTFEEAQSFMVDVGTCKGWTMAQVADRRKPSLKWYIHGYTGDNNALRAAAQIMLDSLTMSKAG